MRRQKNMRPKLTKFQKWGTARLVEVYGTHEQRRQRNGTLRPVMFCANRGSAFGSAAVNNLIKQNYDLVAGSSNIRPRRAQFRGEKLPAYDAPSDDWGHICTRSRLGPLFGLRVCKVRTPWPMGARHTWARDVREVTQAVFCRLRHQPRRPPLGRIRPGSPARL